MNPNDSQLYMVTPGLPSCFRAQQQRTLMPQPAMASGCDHEQGEAEMPHLTVNVSMLGGHACSIHLPSSSTVWVLKSKLKATLGIPKRQQVVLVGGEMAPISRALQNVFGIESGPVHATLARTTAFLRRGAACAAVEKGRSAAAGVTCSIAAVSARNPIGLAISSRTLVSADAGRVAPADRAWHPSRTPRCPLV